MKVINTRTFEIKEISIDSIKLLIIEQASKYDKSNAYNQLFEVSDSLKQSIVQEYVNTLGEDWIDYNNFNDWLYPEKEYRISTNVDQRDSISNDHPEFLVMLNEQPKNPRAKFNLVWEVYLNNFAEGAKEYLWSLGVKIESQTDGELLPPIVEPETNEGEIPEPTVDHNVML
jgi:hypothetical protein